MKQQLKRTALCLTALLALMLTACDTGSNGDDKKSSDDKSGLWEIMVDNITTTSATVHIRPNDKFMLYSWNILPEEAIFEMYDTVEECILTEYEEYMQQWRDYWDGQGADYDWSECFMWGDEDVDIAEQGVMLMGDTTYTIITIAVSETGEVLGTGWKTFHTLPVEANAELTFQITEERGLVTVTPSDPSANYFVNYEVAGYFDGASDDEIIWNYEFMYSNNLANNLVHGISYWEWYYEWLPQSSYSVVVFGYDGGATTGVTVKDFYFDSIDRTRYSKIDSDKTVENCDVAEIFAYGTRIYNMGVNTMQLVLDNRTTGDGLISEFITTHDDDPLDADGRYTIMHFNKYDEDVFYNVAEHKGTAFEGRMQTDGYPLFGTFYTLTDVATNTIVQYAAAEADSGYLSIARVPEKEEGLAANYRYYVIEAEFKDPKGYTITVRHDGPVEFKNMVVFEEPDPDEE